MPRNRFSPLRLAWTRIRDSLWFVPSVSVIVAVALAVFAVQIPTPDSTGALAQVWLFGGGAAGARSMLSAIAGSLITVTGVVFSVTIVALQLASSQFTPRVLGRFLADRVNQAVLGVFIGTFTYTLLVLRTIRSEADDRTLFVPHVAVTLALFLLLVSIAALIVYIDHAARSIQASVILHREAQRTVDRIGILFPEFTANVAGHTSEQGPVETLPAGSATFILATQSGYLQALHEDPLWSFGDKQQKDSITIRTEVDVGAFVFPGRRLATVWSSGAIDEEDGHAIRSAFVLGPERTLEQDVELGIIVIVDIALRALSPGINDPTTATQCIDRLAQILAALGTRGPLPVHVTSPGGNVRVQRRPTSFARAVALAFDQVRLFGRDNPEIAIHLLESLATLGSVVHPDHHETLRSQSIAIVTQARRSVHDSTALRSIEELAATVAP